MFTALLAAFAAVMFTVIAMPGLLWCALRGTLLTLVAALKLHRWFTRWWIREMMRVAKSCDEFDPDGAQMRSPLRCEGAEAGSSCAEERSASVHVLPKRRDAESRAV